MSGHAQLTTDGLHWYVDAVDHAFGIDVDYAMIQKHYGGGMAGERTAAVRYSPTKPAMAAGVTSKLWEVSDLVGLLEAIEGKKAA